MPPFTPTDAARLRESVSQLVAQLHLPGAAVGIVSGGELVFAEGFGHADIESAKPQAPELRHRIGSITKTMIGLCAMALVDEGRLSLGDRLVDHIPDVRFDGPADSIRISHLLTHTSGIGEAPQIKDLADPDFGLWSDNEAPGVADAYPEGIIVEVPAGRKWAYANHAFVLLGEIVARTEKAPIQDIVRRRVFEPLGMADTDLLDGPHPDLTTGYHRPPNEDMKKLLASVGRPPEDETTVDGANIRGRYQYVRGRAAGGVQSTIPDMARYAIALLRDGGGIVRPETFRQMTRPQWQPDPRLPAWGLSFSVREHYGRPSFGHGGAIFGGWNSNITVFPAGDLAVIIHVNAMLDDFDGPVVSRVLHAALGAPAWTPPQAALDPTVHATAPGVYELPMPGPLTNFRPMIYCGRVQIAARDGGLMLYARRGPWKTGVRMLPADSAQPDLFILEGALPQPMVALRDAGGAVTGLRFVQLCDMHRTERAAPWV